MGKILLNLSVAKLGENAMAGSETYVFFIYEDIHYITLHYIHSSYSINGYWMCSKSFYIVIDHSTLNSKYYSI